MNLLEAARMARDALRNARDLAEEWTSANEIALINADIAALEAAIAQAEQEEPAAWIVASTDTPPVYQDDEEIVRRKPKSLGAKQYLIPLYLHPKEPA